MSHSSRSLSGFINAAVLFLALAVTSHVAMAESVESILRASDEKKVADLEAYLAKNPNAEDIELAEYWLVNLYAELNQNDKVLTLLEKQLKAMDPANTPIRQYATVVQKLFETYVQIGDKDKARGVLESTEQAYANDPLVSQLKQYFGQLKESLNRPVKGEVLEISFKDLDGHEVDLAKMKGKVVLVDFWATWCGPCMQELPNVKKTYEQYHDQGFEIIAISLDEDKNSLTELIAKEGIKWPQAFDGKGWENAIAKKYGITSIPATFLIGKDGKIAAMDLRGEQLGKWVKAALEAN